MTNFEKMSVEEMASELERLTNDLCGYYSCGTCLFYRVVGNRPCTVSGSADWLESEAIE